MELVRCGSSVNVVVFSDGSPCLFLMIFSLPVIIVCKRKKMFSVTNSEFPVFGTFRCHVFALNFEYLGYKTEATQKRSAAKHGIECIFFSFANSSNNISLLMYIS